MIKLLSHNDFVSSKIPDLFLCLTFSGKRFCVSSVDYHLINLLIPKYHIYLEYAELDKSGVRFNISQEELNRTFATPFNANQPFWFAGRLLSPIKTSKVVLFWSYETADKLKLPNQESIVAVKDKKYLIESIIKGKVKGVYLCTEKFLETPERATVPTRSVEASLENTRRRIFVVSGTDDVMKLALTGSLTKLLLSPVIIHEEPCIGRKIIEHFSDYNDVKFAVVLLSPDDYVYARADPFTKSKLKPRQDVIFLLGFLLGALGKGNVLVFFREYANFEIPLDFEGIKFTAFDDRDSWKLALIRELIKSGYTVDGKRILK